MSPDQATANNMAGPLHETIIDLFARSASHMDNLSALILDPYLLVSLRSTNQSPNAFRGVVLAQP